MSTFNYAFAVAIGLCILSIIVALAAGIVEASRKRAGRIAPWKTRQSVAFIGLVVVLALIAFGVLEWAPQEWHSPLLVVAFAAAGAALGFLLHFPFDWLASKFKTRISGEVAGHFIGLVGVLYAIVLGFLVVTAWEQYYRTEEISTNEQYDAYDLFNTIAFYDYIDAVRTNPGEQPQINQILLSLARYARGMQAEEQLMKLGSPLYPIRSRYSEPNADCSLPPNPGPTPGVAEGNDNTMALLRCRIVELRATDLRHQAIYQSTLRLLTDLSDLRNNRRHHYNNAPLQPAMWTAFVLGGLILVGLLYLVEPSDSRQKAPAAAAMAVSSMIGMMWALALIFNYPFSGSSPIYKYEIWCNFGSAFEREEKTLSLDKQATISEDCEGTHNPDSTAERSLPR